MSLRKLCRAVPVACILAVALFAAESPFVGTWKLNAAKSKLEGSGMGAATTVRYEATGDGLKASVESTSPQGQPMNFSYQASLDGKDAAVTGSPTFDMISMKRINDHTLTAIGKKDHKVVWTDRRVVSGDGKTMTLTRNGTNAEGKKYHSTAVLEKQ